MARFNQFIKKVKYDNYVFDSREECDYYQYLKELEKNGKVRNIEVHKKFILIDSYNIGDRVEKPIFYEADFVFQEIKNNVLKTRYVDVKGFKDAVFDLKKKIFESRYNVDLEVIKKDSVNGFVPYSVGRKLIKERRKARELAKTQKEIEKITNRLKRENDKKIKNINRYNELKSKSKLTEKQKSELETLEKLLN